ncbi:hypothetical protein O9993_17345 [Vibrio lentus]|nr:hypothetical protein [Vibrio lentus]
MFRQRLAGVAYNIENIEMTLRRKNWLESAGQFASSAIGAPKEWLAVTTVI